MDTLESMHRPDGQTEGAGHGQKGMIDDPATDGADESEYTVSRQNRPWLLELSMRRGEQARRWHPFFVFYPLIISSVTETF